MSKENNFKLVEIDLSDDTSIAAAGTDTQSLTPPVGYTYQVVGMWYNAPIPAGGGSGSHKMEISNGSVQFIEVSNVFGSAFYIQSQRFVGANEEPSNEAGQVTVASSKLFASNSLPLDFKYTNSTDVAQAGTRALYVICKKYREAI